MGTITLTLPEKTLSQAKQAAAALRRPLEDVLSDMLTAMLPEVSGTPGEMQADLAAMTWLDNEALWNIARSEMSAEQQAALQQLAEQQGERSLTSKEKADLEKLRREYGRITLRKARAYSLLSLRGGTPLLENISSNQ
jgi:hypothetical protein